LRDNATTARPTPGLGKFETLNWDQASEKLVRDTLLRIAPTLPDTNGMFGPRNVVADPSRRLTGALRAGAATRKEALYLDVTLARNDAKTIYRLNIKVVPVDGGFWSISVRPGYLCHPGWP